MNKLGKAVFAVVFLISIEIFSATNSWAVNINNVTVTTPGPIRLYEKYEVKFDVVTNTLYPFVQYDSNPPPGVTSGSGITVEATITSPSGKTLKHPAFYMTETTTTGTAPSLIFQETNKKYWVLRFSPQETGSYSVSLSAQDASGTTTSSVGTFQATAAAKDGFIQVSKQDSRYFEFSNGKLYWPVGPANGNNYAQYLGSGMNLERPWMAGRGAYSTNWARWKSSAEQLGNEGIATRLTFFNDPSQKAPGSDGLAYELFYPEGHHTWITGWLDDQFYTPIKSNTSYQVKLVAKTTNIVGPRVTGNPFGLVVKFGPGIFNNPTNDQIETQLRTAPQPFSHITSTSGTNGWQTFQTTFTTPSGTGTDIWIYLDNVTAGQAHIYELSIKDSTGAELVRNPTADNHMYIEQRPAAFFDWQVAQGEQNGVFFKYVVHDKNDWIQNHLVTSGEWAATGDGYYQPENTKARWLLRQWYRYLTARWGYSTAIHSWELNNEGPPNASDTVNGRPSATHWRTAQAFAKYMHDIDAHRHLATTSFWCCWRPDFWLNNLDFGDIDYADLHMYTGNPDVVAGRPYDMALWNYESSMKAYQDEVGKNVFKPVIRAETGISATGGWTPITELNTANPGIWFHNLIWAGINPGGMSDPNYWYSEHFSKINPLAHSRPFSQFISSLDLNGGGYVDAAAGVSNTKIRAWGQKNLGKNKAHLWIQNSDHTWKNVMSGITSSQTGTVTIRLNPNINYTLEQWNTYTGVLANTQNVLSSTTGDLVLTVNSLTDDIAVKISSPLTPTPSPSLTPSSSPSLYPTPTSSPGIGNGDVDGNGTVNTNDIKLIISNWTGATTGSFNQYPDNKINSFDFAVVTRQIPVPSPSSSPVVNATSTPTPSPTASPFDPTPTPVTTTSDWPQLQKDAQHTGRTSVSLAPNYQVAWAWADKTHIVKNFVSAPGNNIFDKASGMQFNVIFSQTMQPVVAEGKTFFSSLNGTIYAVNALTGDNIWDFTTGGPILESAAYTNGVVVAGSMDGKVYGINSNNGTVRWSRPDSAGAGFSAAPVIRGNTVYIGNRDGKFYAIDAVTGSLLWNNQFFSADAPIVSPAALSEDGATVFFGAENMNFYALNAVNGSLKWGPKKLIGQSFLYGWPVVKGNKLVIRTMSSLNGAEFLMEDVLDGLPDGVGWPQEKTAVLNWLNTNPHQKSMYVFDVNTGTEPYQVAMGRVTGNNYTAHPPIVDNQDRLLTYWRSRDATFVTDAACFGTKYCPDISAMDLNSGDRVTLGNPSGNKLGPELDNGFQLTVGGNYLYFANHFRGTHAINLTSGSLTRLTTQSAKWDCGNFRSWGFQLIYYGNDSETSDCTYTNAKPPNINNGTNGFAGVVIASTNNTPMLYVNEGDAGFIVAIKQKP